MPVTVHVVWISLVGRNERLSSQFGNSGVYCRHFPRRSRIDEVFLNPVQSRARLHVGEIAQAPTCLNVGNVTLNWLQSAKQALDTVAACRVSQHVHATTRRRAPGLGRNHLSCNREYSPSRTPRGSLIW